LITEGSDRKLPSVTDMTEPDEGTNAEGLTAAIWQVFEP
jgi:hypothetical protein